MKSLYAICQSKQKIWREFPNGSHNDTVAEPNFFNHIMEYVHCVLTGREMHAHI